MSFLDTPGRVWLMDGAMGTHLAPLGLPCVAAANLTHAAAVRAVHAAYAAAGAEVHLTNTFQVNPVALAAHALEGRLEEVARRALSLARMGAPGGVVLGDVGPLLTPGRYEEFADRHALLRTLEALDGADGLLFETCSTAAALAAVEFALHRAAWLESRPILLSIAYRRGEGGAIASASGHPPEFFARHAARHGVAALGVNCGVGMGPAEAAAVLRRYRRETDLPLFARPNGGSPEDFARHAPELLAAGANLLGGCCGTTAEHVRALASRVAELRS